MAFDCPLCGRSYSTKYNLKRHLQQYHNYHKYDVDDSPNEVESVNSDVDNSSNESSGVSDSADESQSDYHADDDSEVKNTYTHDDVCAVLRYFRLQQNENESQKEV